MANDVVNRFFGGPPLSVLIRLIPLSVLAALSIGTGYL